ncbi:hypothetical protein DPMN_133422 [Dreissena polymorpha]|uniref:Uncharacterized protein n=1 Tax=Dreissena polymorpha TaxID=45954 RepID=A0A9D4FYC6_DREPO|nr:hypothetical protein DPMN_133422 [Dreissena polymorpha]
MNLLTKFHEDRTMNVASRPFMENAPPLGSHVFQANTNLRNKFHEDRKINVASRVLTRKKNAPPLGCHVFQANVTIFELIQDIIQTNPLTKFHEDWTIIMASRVLTRKTAPHVFSPIWTIFELFHDWAEIVTSRVHIGKTAPPPGGHVFQRTTNILTKLYKDRASNVTSTVRGINGTNVLTKFHKDQTINVASRVFTRQNVDDGRLTKGDHNSSP